MMGKNNKMLPRMFFPAVFAAALAACGGIHSPAPTARHPSPLPPEGHNVSPPPTRTEQPAVPPTSTLTGISTPSPTAIPSPTVTSLAQPSFSHPLKPGPVINSENAVQVVLLGSIPEPLIHTYIGSKVAWSPDGRLLAVNTDGEGIRLIDPLTMTEVGEIRQTDADIIDHPGDMAFSPDGTTLAVAIPAGKFSFPNEVAFYDLRTLEPARENIGGQAINVLEYSHHGRWLAVGSDLAMTVEDLSAAKRKWLMHFGYENDNAHFAYATFSQDDAHLAFAGTDSPARIYRTDTWSEERMFFTQGGGLCFSPDSLSVAVNPGIWSIDGYTVIKEFDPSFTVRVCDFGVQGDILVNIVGINSNIDIWDVHTGKIITSLSGHLIVNDIAFSPDGRFIASVGRDTDDTMNIWGIPAE
jgi:WD40 repeat protein